jgi:prepilin-type N-terminal cleavage/methylation domain-containing protein
MNREIRVHKGFTLIELLTVIAIIAILAAIAFPVFNQVRGKTRNAQCMTQMHDIYRNLKLYYADNNRYPASLLGFVQNTNGTFHTGSGQYLPIEQLTYRPLTLGQKYIKDKVVFLCPDNVSGKDPSQTIPNPALSITLQYPLSVPLTGPVVFTDIIANNIRKPVPVDQPIFFYKYDSYDIGPRLGLDGKPVPNAYDLHYSLDWTGQIGPNDRPNQLKYASTAPEDATVVTWCTHHAALGGGDMVNVLMLSGKTKPAQAKDFVQKGPLNFKF